MFVNV